MLRGRLIDHLFPARVEKTVSISVTGVLMVSLSYPSRSYVGTIINLSIQMGGIGPWTTDVDWGDGSSHSGSEADTRNPIVFQHIYATAKTYTITVNAKDETTEMTGSNTGSIQIAAALTITFTVDKTSGAPPFSVVFTCGASGGYLNYSWNLDPGDGATPYTGTRTASGTWTQSHTYNKVGAFTAKLTVDDALGTSVYGQISIGAGVPILFPRLRERFPRLFERLDKRRQKIPTR